MPQVSKTGSILFMFYATNLNVDTIVEKLFPQGLSICDI